MIELNLLPKELRKNKARRKKKSAQITVFPIAVIALCFIVVVHILLGLMLRNNERLSAQLEAKWQEMQPQKEKTEAIARQISELQKRLAVVKKISRPEFDLTKLLTGINESVISNIWLSDFDLKYASKGPGRAASMPQSLFLTGYALGKSGIGLSTAGKFMDELKRNKILSEYLEEFELQNIENTAISGEEVVRFRLIGQFKKTEPAAEKAQAVTKKKK
ncbi:MAG: hypothetical protein ABH883_02050 [Candidatus Omnitrophota bacterium]